MDFDSSSDEDTESELNDLKQLTAVLTADEASTSETASRLSTLVASTSKAATTSTQELRKIETSLALNKLYDEKLRRLENLLGARLNECRKKLEQVQSVSTGLEKNDLFRFVSCGKPYFKDKLGCPAPENEDSLMAQSQMYDFSQIVSVPGWSVKDKSQFINAIHKCSRDIRKKELHSKIAALKRQIKLIPNPKIVTEITELEKEMHSLGKESLAQVALPIDVEYDWDMIANQLPARHSAQEYQSLWKLFLHPSINKNSWSTAEHSALQIAVSEHREQDWDAIAKDLNTGRTGYQCFVYYRTNVSTSNYGKKWTPEEVMYLKRLIDYFKEDNYIPWGKVAAAMENRTKIQIYNKYLRLFEQRKGRFLPQEDAVILNFVRKFGVDFKKMTTFLPGRSVSQLRSRYHVIKTISISSVWTVDDDKKLLRIMSNSHDNTKLCNYAEAVKYFPGRSRTALRSRYITLLKWMKAFPNTSIELAPRRGARRLNHGHASVDLNKALEELKNTLNTQAVSKSSKKKLSIDSPEVEIEDAIIAILINKMVHERELKKMAEEEQAVLRLNNQTVSRQTLNVTNLHNTLIFLESSLRKDTFISSYYNDSYPTLINTNVSLVSIKSYSKKNAPVNLAECPNIWGQFRLSQRKFVMPPHYATITGCKGLLSKVATVKSLPTNISLLLRRNAILKDQYNRLLERFYVLFLWPMLLSNEKPPLPKEPSYFEEPHAKDKQIMRTTKVPRTLLPDPPPIAIPKVSKKYVRQSSKKGSIDLKQSDKVNLENISIKPDMLGLFS